MAVDFPSCHTLLLCSTIELDEHGLLHLIGLLSRIEVATFPHQVDGLDVSLYLDGESGQYEHKYRVTDATGRQVGEGHAWGRFDHDPTTVPVPEIGETVFTSPELPGPGVYTFHSLLRKDGEVREVARFRVELVRKAEEGGTTTPQPVPGQLPHRMTYGEKPAPGGR